MNAAETTFSYDPNVIQVNGPNGITVNKTTFDLLAVTPQAPSDASSNTLAYAGGSANNATGSFEVFSIEFITVGVGTTDFTFFAENSVLLTEQELLRNLSAPTITVSGVVAPVDLLSFTGRTDNRQNLLEWATASEDAFSHYEVERRSADDAGNWEVVGEVAGTGSLSVAQRYSFVDATPPNSAYYRLRMVDLDGTFAYSDVIHLVQADAAYQLDVYPNPNDGRFTVRLPATDESLLLTLHDANGRIIWERKPTAGQPELTFSRGAADYSTATLAAGIYLLSAKSDADLWMQRIVIK